MLGQLHTDVVKVIHWNTHLHVRWVVFSLDILSKQSPTGFQTKKNFWASFFYTHGAFPDVQTNKFLKASCNTHIIFRQQANRQKSLTVLINLGILQEVETALQRRHDVLSVFLLVVEEVVAGRLRQGLKLERLVHRSKRCRHCGDGGKLIGCYGDGQRFRGCHGECAVIDWWCRNRVGSRQAGGWQGREAGLFRLCVVRNTFVCWNTWSLLLQFLLSSNISDLVSDRDG